MPTQKWFPSYGCSNTRDIAKVLGLTIAQVCKLHAMADDIIPELLDEKVYHLQAQAKALTKKAKDAQHLHEWVCRHG